MNTEDSILTAAERQAVRNAACFASVPYEADAGRQLRLCNAIRKLSLREACEMTGENEQAAAMIARGRCLRPSTSRRR